MQGVWIILLFRIFCFLDPIYSLELNYSLLEQSEPNGHVIGNIAEDSDLFAAVENSADRKYVRFSIVSDNNPFSSYFRVNESSSDLFNTIRVDREAIEDCKYEDRCSLPLIIVARSSSSSFSFFQKISVIVEIIDINDNQPRFPRNHTSIAISEASVVDSAYPLDSATDLDKGENSIQKYEILPPGTPFTLRYTKFVDGSSSVSVVLKEKLDREKEAFYSLQVLAIDGGNPTHTGTLHVTINVTDDNDNKPHFGQSTYRITVNENVSVGSTIFKLNASDADVGENGRISYYLSQYQSEEIRRLFAITEDTGLLTTSQSLMYSPGTEYRIIIEATDNAQQPLTSQVEVYVTVLDSLNDPPEVYVNFLSGTGSPSISENKPVGSAVAHVRVVDKDTGNNGDVSCNVQSDILELKDYGVKEYKLELTTSLDREVTDSYSIVLVCNDKGSPSLNSTKRITIQIDDWNDNAPVFSQSAYFVDFPENNRLGQTIFTVQATDKDLGDNAEITYSLYSGDKRFSIDSKTGAISANFRMDRENVSRYDFIVMGTDGGTSPMAANVTLQLTVLDRNDNRPVFDFSIYTFTVEENRPADTHVGDVSASDLDIGLNGEIEYILLQNPDVDLPFRVLSNGSIVTTGILDRESNLNGYNFKIIAQDRGGNSALNSTCHVTVFASDVNDNSPTFLFPSAENFTLVVLYDVPKNSIIGSVKAVDKDYELNSEVTYSMVDSSSMFQIDRNSGNISLTRALTTEDLNRYVININAEDRGNPKLSTNQSLVIIVTSHTLPPGRQNGGGPSSESYMLIAVVISCVTVIVAGVIVLFIFLLRRHDKNKEKSHNSNPLSKPVNNGQHGMYDSLDRKQGLRLDTSSKLDTGSDVSQNPSPNTSHEELLTFHRGSFRSPPSITGDEVEKILERITPETRGSLSSYGSDHQYRRVQPMSSFAKSPSQHIHKGDFSLRVMDNHSEHSVESNTSDSGRGASDCEVHSNGTPTIPEDVVHMPNPTFRPQRSRNQSKESIHSESRHKGTSCTQIPEYANLPCNNINTPYPHNPHISGSNGSLSGKHLNVPSSTNYPHVSYSSFRRDKEPAYLYHKHKPSVHMTPLGGSLVTLDDDGSTTTSGSYTIDESGNGYVMSVV